MAVLMPRTMAALNEEFKPLHPFFQKPSKARPFEPAKNDPTGLSAPCDEPNGSKAPKKASSTAVRKPKKSAVVEKVENAAKSAVTKDDYTGNTELLEVDLNDRRRKRRKTTSPIARRSSDENEAGTVPSSPLPQKRERRRRARVINDSSSPTKPEGTTIPPGNEMINEGIKASTEGSIEAPATIASTDPAPEDQETLAPDGNNIPNEVLQALLSSYETKKETLPVTPPGPDVIIVAETPKNSVEEKPKKVLRLNPKTGTFGSPPPKKPIPVIDAVPKTRSTRAKQPKKMVVTILYGDGHLLPPATGQKLESILSGTRTAASYVEEKAPKVAKPPRSMKISGTGPVGAPHPFFMAKTAPKPSPSLMKAIAPTPDVIEIPRPNAFSNLGRAQPTSKDKLLSPSKPKPSASTSAPVFAGFGAAARILKYPGAIEPAWPWKGMVHIRGEGNGQHSSAFSSDLQPKPKKSKYRATTILAEDDILQILATDLPIKQLLKDLNVINPYEYPPLPARLRIPIKHFETGPNLQRSIRKELKARLPFPTEADDSGSSEDEIQESGSTRSRVHPALTKLYSSVATSLSAFDKSECETQAWTQKYAPTSAAEVLQTGREALILKEWLLNLTIISVETGASSVSRASSSKPEATGKRKRKFKKLDGFVVSSDEEEDMDEISEPEDDSSPRSSQGLLKKTVVKAGNATKDSTRFSNGVVISGPHGCGKSAVVYAVAKELGYEVFEINSSSRRSGKDILEKVGDMTRNHLVQHSHTQAPVEPVDEDAKRISDALDNDLKTGRQGTMNSFFKSKEPAKVGRPTSKMPAPAPNQHPASQQTLASKAPKLQKQSLILFEEVDILYEEDKQFWATVIGLIVQSKRPIIMTCTDETAVPIQSLPLHAILRLPSPPIDLATDYMLLVAASEGHILQREAIKTLYEGRHLDLRASLTEINFWCQFAIGSVRGGLDWFYERWPPGKDLDKDGKIIRVISERTYEAGMGWLSQDFLESHINYLDIEEETLHEAWDGWHLDVGDWPTHLNLTSWADRMQSLPKEQSSVHDTLAMYEDFAESLSAADVCSAGSFSSNNKVLMDTGLPALSLKVREDYVLAHELIEATPLVNFGDISQHVAIWIKSRARKYLQVDQHTERNLEIPTELDRPSEDYILDLIKGQTSSESSICRLDYSLAFDPISEPEKSLWNTGSLEASAFDRTMAIIATDVAPFVRSIVAYDASLQQERTRLSNLLSEGGRKGKRMRTTRAAMSALEGGARTTTRKERYFGPGLNPHLVLKTGMQSWLDALNLQAKTDTITEESKEEVMEAKQTEDTAERDELDEE